MATSSQDCGFKGNSDIYGLGIRLGIYLQWITSKVAVYFHLEGSNDLSAAYFIFSIALQLALYVLTFQHDTYTIEAVIIFYIYYGGLLSVNGYRKRYPLPAPSVSRAILANALGIGMGVYGACTWPWEVFF